MTPEQLFDDWIARKYGGSDLTQRIEARREYNRRFRSGYRRPYVARALVVRLLEKTDRRYGDVPEGRPELGRCWVWQGARNVDGYGVIRGEKRSDGKQPLVLCHRVALELALGRSIAAGMFGNHHCDNPRCVRPSHLYEGTATENVGDMIARRRYRGVANVYGDDKAAEE